MVAAKQRNLNAKASIADIASEVENDFWEIVRKLAQAQRMSTKTVHATLHKDLKLSKKFARRLPKLTDTEMKKKRARMYKVFKVMTAAVS